MSKPIDRAGCQSLLRNLLRMPERDMGDVANIWIREFMTTERCDKHYDLSERREAWKQHLGTETYNAVMSYSQDAAVRERAAGTLEHYLYYDRKMLAKGLNWWNWFGYQLVDRPQMTALYLTVIGGGATAAWKIASKTVRASREAAHRGAQARASVSSPKQ
jgi:hypothetical protein